MDLIKRVVKLKSKIEKHRDDINNETATRYALIDPVLKELGWRLDDPVEVRYEEGDGGRWDYKLGARMLIEAKKLDGLKPKDEDQLIAYLQKNNMGHGVLTDGNVWQKFTVSPFGHDQDFRIKITQGNPAKISKHLSDLDRNYVMRIVSPTSPDDDLQRRQAPSGVPISQFRPDGKLPVGLVCGDKPPVTCNHWIDVLVGVTDYLVDGGYITKSDCPLASGPKSAILNTREYHQTGAKMRFSKRTRSGLYLNANLNSQAVVSNARKIIEHAGLGFDDFRITKPGATGYDSSSPPAPVEEWQAPSGVPISQFRPDGKLPVGLVCGDKPPVTCNHWIDVLVGVAEHLIDSGHMTESRCPFPPGLKNPIVTVENKTTFPTFYRLVRGRFFLYIKLDKFCILRSATRLIEHSGLDQSDFRIRLRK
ncbi:MAG: hypothetical protein OXP12_05215 [Thaumarchaeota archaeon]|nr:hypothetical protein [Nitrososphaerota archaeon]